MMNHHAETILDGHVTDVFAHRFVVRTAAGKVLADLGPKGAEQVKLCRGDQVSMTGDMKPSELKVSCVVRSGGQPVPIDHKSCKPDESKATDAGPALRTAEANGFTVLGTPRRKPKHFEVLGRDSAGDVVELHIEFDGHLRKTKPVEDGDGKWAAALQAEG